MFFDTAFLVAVTMAAFTILFGLRTVEAAVHHRGLMMAIAFESVVKLIALLAVGYFVTYQMAGGADALMRRGCSNRPNWRSRSSARRPG